MSTSEQPSQPKAPLLEQQSNASDSLKSPKLPKEADSSPHAEDKTILPNSAQKSKETESTKDWGDCNGDQQTPTSYNMSRFMTCFKSEPNLSKALRANSENVPMLSRGRFIAKKLIGGVSMVNLRLALSGSSEKKSESRLSNQRTDANKRIVFEKSEQIDRTNTTDALPEPAKSAQRVEFEDDIDDEDFDEKENLPDIECEDDSPFMQATKTTTVGVVQPAAGGSSSMSGLMIGDAVSPITKSTHRMSKAMQVSRTNESLARKIDHLNV